MSEGIIGLAYLAPNLQRQNGELSSSLCIATFLTAFSSHLAACLLRLLNKRTAGRNLAHRNRDIPSLLCLTRSSLPESTATLEQGNINIDGHRRKIGMYQAQEYLLS
jgi:hypothetical protein